MYKRKTTDEYAIMTNYGEGFEEEDCETTLREAKKRAKEYRENTNAQVEIKKRRVKRESHE